jgi:hypothetical protein
MDAVDVVVALSSSKALVESVPKDSSVEVVSTLEFQKFPYDVTPVVVATEDVVSFDALAASLNKLPKFKGAARAV